MTGQEWMEVIVMLLCFVLAALASGTETALTSVGRLRVRYLAEQGSQAAAILQRLRADPNRFLSTVLFTNTRALIGGRAARAPYLTEEELLAALHVSEEAGVIEEQEHQMIHGIIEIGDKTVREIMIPRTDIVAVDREAQLRDIVKLFKQHRHTRMPVFEHDIDHVVGLFHTKDLLLFYTLSSSRKFDMDKVLRPIEFTPEQKKVDELLNDMRTKKVHMMIVVDEYGGTAGLVTLEDLLEEIVGEIRDEYDTAEQEPLLILNDHEARVDATFPLEELNERLHLGIEESGDYASVGGYVHSMLGKIAEEGDSFQSGRAKWIVEKVRGRRIELIRLVAEEPWPTEVHGHDGAGEIRVEEQTGHLP